MSGHRHEANSHPHPYPRHQGRGPGPFDLARLRVPTDYESDAAVKKLLTTVPVRRPHRQEWISVHPSELYREVLMAVELKEEREVYLAPPHIAQELPGEIQRRMLYTVQNASRVTFLWPVKVAAPGERLDPVVDVRA